MVDLRKKVEVELEYIEQIFQELPPFNKLPDLSILELAGVATLLHNFYNGIENIIKQILNYKNIPLSIGEAWHKELLNLALKSNIISKSTKNNLGGISGISSLFQSRLCS